MFDSNASRGRLIEIDCSFIASDPVFLVVSLEIPALYTDPFETITLPPRVIISARIILTTLTSEPN